MASFSKEIKAAFDKVLEGFEDALVVSGLATVFETDQVSMERSNDTIWRPMPYIATSYNGSDQTANFTSPTQLAVPASISIQKSSPFQLDAKELRDQLQKDRLGVAARQKLASDINVSLQDILCNQATLFVKRSGAAAGFDDVAAIDTALNARGIPMEDRVLVLSSANYNAMASNLQVASRSLDNETSTAALRRAYVGMVSGIETYKLDYANRKTAAAGGGGLTASTTYVAGGTGNYFQPQAISIGVAGQMSPVDNRSQVQTWSSTTNVVAGDSFTLAGVNAAHMITKKDSGVLQTFRVLEVLSANTLRVSPAMVNVAGVSQAEQAYGNCVITAQSGTAAIVFLNTVTGDQNPFYVKGALELLPGRLAIEANGGAEVLRATTKQGIEIVMQKQFDIKTQKTLFRFDSLWGVVLTNPSMAGIEMFSQT